MALSDSLQVFRTTLYNKFDILVKLVTKRQLVFQNFSKTCIGNRANTTCCRPVERLVTNCDIFKCETD